MSLVKYRLKEVATDFGVTPKDIAEVMGKFFEKPKSNTQVLTEEELNVVFDYMTQIHQITSLALLYHKNGVAEVFFAGKREKYVIRAVCHSDNPFKNCPFCAILH